MPNALWLIALRHLKICNKCGNFVNSNIVVIWVKPAANRFLTKFSHQNSTHTKNKKNAFTKHSFILGCSCTTRKCVIKKKSSRLVQKSSRFTPLPKNKLYCIAKLLSGEQNQSCRIHQGGGMLADYLIFLKFHDHWLML